MTESSEDQIKREHPAYRGVKYADPELVARVAAQVAKRNAELLQRLE